MEDRTMSNKTTAADDQEPRMPDCEYVEWLENHNRALQQALTWCVVNDGETLLAHPRLLARFRQILGMERGSSD
jgi:hypothetical protein